MPASCGRSGLTVSLGSARQGAVAQWQRACGGFGFWGLMSRGAKCPVRKGAGRGKGVGGRADSRLQGFGFWGSMSRAQGAGRGARGARRGKGSGGGRGWARGALGTATRAAAPGDGRGGGP